MRVVLTLGAIGWQALLRVLAGDGWQIPAPDRLSAMAGR